MKDLSTMLTVLVEASSIFSDKSAALCDFGSDTESVTLATSDSLYLGYTKQLTSVFFQFATPSTSSRTVSVFAFNGSSWVQCVALDDTKGFTRSGNITWRLPTSVTETTVNSTNAWWIKITVSANTTAMSVQAISQVFSDDRDLLVLNPKILDSGFLLGQASHILHHEAARDEIVQKFRNKGLYGRSTDTDKYQNLTFWDLLDFQEVRLAAAHLATSKVFALAGNASDANDRWVVKAREHKAAYEKNVELAFLTYDRLGDGSSTEPTIVACHVLRRG
jgi:hypothetical protein